MASETTPPPASVFLPWDANEFLAAERINQLLVADGSVVNVHRSGDGHASAEFTITFLGTGYKPMLSIARYAGLLQRQALANVSIPDVSMSDDVSASLVEVVRGGADLMPLPGRYLTAPANESVVSVRLKTQTTAICGKPDWDTALSVGCFEVGRTPTTRWSAYAGVTPLRTISFLHSSDTTTPADLSLTSRINANAAFGVQKCTDLQSENLAGGCGAYYTPATQSSGWNVYYCKDTSGSVCGHTGAIPSKSKITLERCESACRGSGAAAFAVVDADCECLSTEPETDASAPKFNCSATCGADESQICGGNFTQTCSARSLAAIPPRCTRAKYFASIYRMPAYGEALPCKFELDSSVTPTLSAAYPTALASGSILTIEGSGFTSSAGYSTPVVTVCGAVLCPTVSSNYTHVLCLMPECSTAASEALAVHISPIGYAANPASAFASFVVKGVLSLTTVRLSSSSNMSTSIAEGSAAGGVLLTLSGGGFDDEPSRMRVEVVDASSFVVTTCEVLSSSSATRELTCTTVAAASPLEAAGTLCAVRVSALDSTGSVTATRTLASSYQLVAQADSMVVQTISPAGGSTEGGTIMCIGGQHLDKNLTGAFPPIVMVGSAVCDTTNTTWNATDLCCNTSNALPGLVNVSVYSALFGYALHAPSSTMFNYSAAPELFAVSRKSVLIEHTRAYIARAAPTLSSICSLLSTPVPAPFPAPARSRRASATRARSSTLRWMLLLAWSARPL